jgi:hypothetical protein
MQPQKWKQFEAIAHRIQKELTPDATVTLGDHLDGRISKTSRQIDISVRQRVGQYDILITIDCKDLAVPVDVKDVESVIELFKDVGSNKGAIVSAKGFTEAAKTRALASGLELYRLIDTQTEHWNFLLSIPVVYVFRFAKAYSLRFISSTPTPLVIPAGDPRLFEIFDGSKNRLGTIDEIIARRWNGSELPIEVGEHKEIPLVGLPILIRHERDLYHVEISFDLVVGQKLFFGKVPVRQVVGFYDEINKALIAKRFSIDAISFERVRSEWKEIESMESIAVRPLVGIVGAAKVESAFTQQE